MKEYNKNIEKKRISKNRSFVNLTVDKYSQNEYLSKNRSFVNLTVDKYSFCDWKSIDISHETSKTGSGIQNLVYNFAKKERQEKL